MENGKKRSDAMGSELPEFINPMDLQALNKQQQESLEELKSRFSNEVQDGTEPDLVAEEYYLLHWLKARRFDVTKAEAMLRHHLRYRKAMKMDEPEYKNYQVHPVMANYFTRGHYGTGRHGHPVVYFPFGGIDPDGITNSVRVSEQLQCILYFQEERRLCFQQLSKKMQKRIQQAIYVIDLKGLGAKHVFHRAGIEAFQQVARCVELQTPEIIYKVFIINAPSMFSMIYALIKPILDENTKRKMQIFGSSGWEEALLKEIDTEQLPVYYGGSAVDSQGDSKLSQHIKYGGDVPKEYHFAREGRETRLLPPSVPLTPLTIRRSAQHLLPFNIHNPSSVLFWYFETDAHLDIGFSIYRIPEEHESLQDPNKTPEAILTPSVKSMDSLEMVFPYFRLLTHICPEWGHLKITKAGTYVIQFDNSYSWVHSKTIKYYAVVAEPGSKLMSELPLNNQC